MDAGLLVDKSFIQRPPIIQKEHETDQRADEDQELGFLSLLCIFHLHHALACADTMQKPVTNNRYPKNTAQRRTAGTAPDAFLCPTVVSLTKGSQEAPRPKHAEMGWCAPPGKSPASPETGAGALAMILFFSLLKFLHPPRQI